MAQIVAGGAFGRNATPPGETGVALAMPVAWPYSTFPEKVKKAARWLVERL